MTRSTVFQVHAGELLQHLLDPRGRADRRAMLATTIGLLALQVGVAGLFAVLGANLQGALFTAINLLFLWMGAAVLVKRLHDIGWSGWWILPAVLFWIVGFAAVVIAIGFGIGFERLDSLLKANPLMMAALTGIGMIPPLGGLLWLQSCPGVSHTNRFGAVPGELGFSLGHAKDSRIQDISSPIPA